MRNLLGGSAALLAASVPCISAMNLDCSDAKSIKSTASTIAHGMMSYYSGNVTNTPETIGVLSTPYYWWEAGAMWGALIDYYHYTGDASYNDVLTQALVSQIGPNSDFMVPRHTGDEGNDDQAFWGFAAMSAAEKNYPQPKGSQYSWVQLVERLWNTQVQRWETDHCGGGLRWQIFSSNNGYNYKNTVSNGAFFQLSARLARFTGNQTYAEWAEKSYNWVTEVGLVTSDYSIYDGADLLKNCTDMTKIMWTYNAGIYLYGSAMMYNYTNGSDQWNQRTQGFLEGSKRFFSPFPNATNVMYEGACEVGNTCNNDQYSFKAYLSRFMWASTVVAPFTASTVTGLLTNSAQAAATSCSGPKDGATCGTRWYWGAYDGKYGVGQQMSALETIQGLLASSASAPIVQGQGAPSSQVVQSSKSSSASSVATATASSSHSGQNQTSPAATPTASSIISKQKPSNASSSACSTATRPIISSGASPTNSSSSSTVAGSAPSSTAPTNHSPGSTNGATPPQQGAAGVGNVAGDSVPIGSPSGTFAPGTSPSANSTVFASFSPAQQRPVELLLAIVAGVVLMLR